MKRIIVIGTGILGASTAYHLAKRNVEVVTVDRSDQGQATSAAAGIINPWLTKRRNQAWFQLAKNGACFYPDLIQALTEDGEYHSGYKRVGAIKLQKNEEKREETVKLAYKQKENSAEIGEIKSLNEQQTSELVPFLNETYSSVYISGAARVNGIDLQNSLLRAAKKHGAEHIHGDARLLTKENKVIGVEVDGISYEADIVIAATGSWMNDLLKPLHIELNIMPQRAQIIHLQTNNVDTSHLPIVLPPNNQYILPFEDGRIIVGATHETDVGFDYRVTAGGVHEVLNKALEIAPYLADSTVLETKVGFRPMTKGSFPIIGALPGYEGILLANGLGASGLTTGPFLGAELAKLALGENIEIDLNNYLVKDFLK